MNNIYLSKSKYCKAVQCNKILWLNKYKPEEAVQTARQSVFDNGTKVGEIARGLFGEYNSVEYNENLQEMIEQTINYLKQKPNIITEASFNFDNNFCSVDILNNKENNISSRRKKVDKKDSEKELKMESLIGINDIKKEIDKIVNYVKICKERKNKLPSLHMCFTGNPGTGKTTVARILGQIFKEQKILSKGGFVEIHGRDLVGQFVGWTAQEVQRHVRRAKGGILFIDEAYSLNSDTRGSFEDEAIATLIKEMEDNRDDLCVILAGYKDEMKDLIDRNPGFESRIQFYIDFPDYNESELYEIFKNLVKKENYKLSNQIKDYLEDYFAKSKKSPTFANGRFVRNLYEKVKIEQANRVAGNKNQDINLIKKCDIENVLGKIQVKQEVKRKIGF